MSQYMNFFIRIDDKFYKIEKFSRNHAIYQELDKYCHIPYGKISLVTTEILQGAVAGIKEDKESDFQGIKKIKEEIQLIASMNNSVKEKLNALRCSKEILKEYEEGISDYDYAIDFCLFLYHIIENFYDNNEESIEKGLYVGIETGKPTVEDII